MCHMRDPWAQTHPIVSVRAVDKGDTRRNPRVIGGYMMPSVHIITQPEDLVDPVIFLNGCREPLLQYRECLMKNLQDWNRR